MKNYRRFMSARNLTITLSVLLLLLFMAGPPPTYAADYTKSGNKVELDYDGNSTALTVTQSGTGDIVNIKDSTSPVLLIKDGGNVGIGDTTPDGLLDVEPTGAVTAASYGINLSNLTTNSTTDAVNKYGLYLTSTGTWTGSGGTATNNYGLYVDTVSGADNNYGAYLANNVGIGTTAPASALSVGGAATTTTPELRIYGYTTDTQAGEYGYFKVEDTTDIFEIGTESTLDGIRLLPGAAKPVIIGDATTAGSHSIADNDSLIVTGNLEVDGTTWLDGNIALGDAVVDTITVNGTISASGTATFSDQLTVQGTALLATTAGRVGIGTTVPSEQLTVASAGKLAVYRSDNNRRGILYTDDSGTKLESDSAGNDPLYFFSPGASGEIRFTTSTTEKMRLNALGGLSLGNSYLATDAGAGSMIASGSVGIGTTAPTSTLSVSGSGLIQSSTNITKALQVLSSQGTSVFQVDTTNGRVGIGTTVPAYELHIEKNVSGGAGPEMLLYNVGNGSTYTGRTGAIHFYNWSGNTDSNTNRAGSIIFDTINESAATDLAFRLFNGGADSQSEIMRLKSTGKVGIGTTAPATGLHIGTAASTHSLTTANDVIITGKLEVDGETFLDGDINLGDIVTDTITINGTISASGTASFSDQLTVQGTALLATTAGRVGIGTTAPSYRLHVPWLSGDAATTAYFGSSNASNDQIALQGVSYSDYGVIGVSTSSYGVYGGSTSSIGVRGVSTDSYGVYGSSTSNIAIWGVSTDSYGIYGTSTSGVGARGSSTSSIGVYGNSTSSHGVYGISGTGRSGYFYRNNTAGTATTAVMDIVQDSATSETNTVLRIQGDGTGDLVNIFDGASEVVTVLDGGSVGIGTTAPATQLDVTGSGAFTGNVAITKHLAVGTNGAVSATTLIDADETYTLQTGTAYGQVLDVNLVPAGALSGSTTMYGQQITAAWDSTQDGETTNALVYALRATGRSLDAGATGDINRVAGVKAEAIHYGTGTVGTLAGLHGYVANSDAYDERGDVSQAYSVLAEAFTDKTTGTITNRYGLRVNDTIGAGNLTNQYGIYIETIDAASSTNYALFSNGGTNYFGGNVGIGTTAPTSTLTVSGSGLIQSSANITKALQVLSSQGTSVFNVDTTNGSVGIGTTAPSAGLDILSGNVYNILNVRSSAAGGEYLKFGAGTGASVIGYSDTGALWFQTTNTTGNTGGTTIMTLTSAGNVGIGTTAPASGAKLHVAGSGVFDSKVGIGTTVPVSGLQVGAGTTGHSLSATGDVYVTGNLEVDGTTWLDGNITLGDVTTDILTVNATSTYDGTGSFTNNLVVSGISYLGGTDDGLAISADGYITDVDDNITLNEATDVNGNLAVGGGYGDTGATISSAGVLQANGAITTDGALTADSTAIGGGYGSTGVTISNAGVIQANGALTIDGASTLTGAATIGGSADGLSVTTDGALSDVDDALTIADEVAISATTITPALLITQSGTGNLANLKDGATAVFTIADGGALTIKTTTDSTTGIQVLDADGGTPIINIDTTNERVGIGTTTPAQALDVAGTVEATGFKMTTSPTAGYFLTTDTNGSASWAEIGSSDGAWTVTGNNLYPDDTAYRVAIGSTSPSQMLHVAGSGEFDNNIIVTGQATVGGGYGATGVTISNAGAIQANAGLTVDGASTLSGTATLSKALYVTGYSVIGSWSTTHSLGSAGDLKVTGKLEVDGETFLDGDINLGDIVTDTITINGTISASGTASFSDQLTVQGTALLATTAGRVGIGTTAPGANLHIIAAGTSGTPAIQSGTVASFQRSSVAGATSTISIISGNTAVAQLLFGDTDEDNKGLVKYDNNVDSLTLGTSATTVMTLTSGRDVGIGTTLPAGQLHTTGTALFATTSGQVGIGTTAPNSKLHVNSSVSGSSGTQYGSYIYSEDAQSGAANYYGAVIKNSIASVGTGTYRNFSVQQVGSAFGSTTEVFGLLLNGGAYIYGNLGIGTTAPAVTQAGTLQTIGTALFATTSGNVGIGTTAPSEKFEVRGAATTTSGDMRSLIMATDTTSWAQGVGGGIVFRGYCNTNPGLFINYGGIKGVKANDTVGNYAGQLHFQTCTASAYTTKMVINEDGLVGIGNNVPAAKLDVIGSGRFITDAAAVVGLTVQGTASQTGNLQQWQDSNGDNVLAVEADGDLFTDRWTSSNTNTLLGVEVAGQNTLSHGSGTEGWYNTAVGNNSLKYVTTGRSNSALGYQALNKTTSGHSNVASGSNALYANTTGDYNVGQGLQALYRNTTGVANVGIGLDSLRNNGTGSYNIAVGSEAGYGSYNSSNIANNIFIGYKAGYAVLTGGDNNIMIGYQAGDATTTGSGNIIIGYDIDAPTAATDSFLNIGDTIYSDLSTDKVGIGNTAPATGLHIGTAASTHSLTSANDVIITGKLEVDGETFLDGDINLGDIVTDTITINGTTTSSGTGSFTNNLVVSGISYLGGTDDGLAVSADGYITDVDDNITLNEATDVNGNLAVGGGYGDTGATISSAGVLQANGAITTDGALTSDNEAIGGGYGSTGVTISNAGVIQANGALTIDGASTLTGAATIGGADDGLSVTNDGALSDVDDALTIADEVSISATTTTPALLVVQSGTGDILNIKDGATSVFRIEDGGAVSFGAAGSLVLGSAGESTDLIFYEDSNISAVGTGTISIGQSGNTIYLASDGATYNFSTLETTAGTNLTLKPGGSNYTIVGDAGSTSHSLAANDDLYITGKLEVDGETFLDGDINLGDIVTDTITVNGTISASGTASFSDQLTVQGTALLATTAGRVGIGTTAPLRTLQVQVPDIANEGIMLNRLTTTTGDDVGLYFSLTTAPTTSSNQFGAIKGHRAEGMSFWDSTSGTLAETMRLKAGKVGIGITAPAAQLHTTGTAVFATTIGSVGIGTTTPDAGLHLYKPLPSPDDLGDFDNYQLVVQGGTTTTNTAAILLSTSADTFGGSAIVHYDEGNGGIGDMVFYTKQATTAVPPVEVMRLDSAGNVGIGTTAPASGAKLHVAGTGIFDGKVGIGTTVPANKMTVSNSGNSIDLSVIGTELTQALYPVNISGNSVTSNQSGLVLYAGDVDVGSNQPQMIISGSVKAGGYRPLLGSIVFSKDNAAWDNANTGTWTNGYIAFHSHGAGPLATEKMRIMGNGNVGIGTTAPAAKLETYTGAAATIGLTVRGTASQSANLQEWQNSAGTPLTVVDEGGFIGIGTTAPATGLHIGTAASTHSLTTANDVIITGKLEVDGETFLDGDINLGDIVTDTITINGTISASGTASFSDQLTVQGTALLATVAGRVGVGTTAPGYRLEVPWLSGDAVTTAYFGSDNASNNQNALYGRSYSGYGVLGASTSAQGVYGSSSSNSGVYGISTSSIGVRGSSTSYYGVYGTSTTNSAGYFLRNNTAGTATTAVVDIVQDSATSETNTVLRIQGDGTGDLVNIFDGASEVVTILDGGNVGIGTTVPAGKLEVVGTALLASTSVGIVVIGTGDAVSNVAGNKPIFQIHGRAGGAGPDRVGAKMALLEYRDSTGFYPGGRIYLGKSRSDTTGTPGTVVQLNDPFGAITFVGDDGTDFGSPGAEIQANVDGTPGSDDMPGRLVFLTTADGTATLSERMRIDSAGLVGIGTTAPTSTLSVSGSGLIQSSTNITKALQVLSSQGTSVFQVDTTNGRVGIGTTAPSYKLQVDNGATAAYPLNLVSSSKFVRIGALNSTYAHVETDATSGFYFYDSVKAGADNHHFNISSGNSYLVANGGNVGIGATAPASLLSVGGAATTTTPELRVYGYTTDTQAGEYGYFKVEDTTDIFEIGTESTVNGIRLLPGATKPVIIGDATTAGSHSIADNDSLIISGNLEVDGTTWLDGNITLGDAVVDTITVNGTTTSSGTGSFTNNLVVSGISYLGGTDDGLAIDADGYITDVDDNITLNEATDVNGNLTAASTAIGGGYGATGATISTAGVIQANGAITTDGALTADSTAIGGGYGSTGVTISNAGAIQANAGLTVDGASTLTGSATLSKALYVTGYSVIGSWSTTHSLGSAGDLKVTGKLEVDGETFLDGDINLGDIVTDTITVNGTISASGTASFSDQLTVQGTALLATTAGRVGIGTTVPGVTLDVAGAANFGTGNTANSLVYIFNSGLDTSLDLYSDGTREWRLWLDDSGADTGANAFKIVAGAVSPVMMELANDGTKVIFPNGNVGIGTTAPAEQLHTTGTAVFATTSGQVGIGTTTPTTKLDVSGAVKVTGTYVTAIAAGINVAIISESSGTMTLSSFGSSTEARGAFSIYLAKSNNGSGITPFSINTLGDTTTTGSSFFATTAGNVGIGTTAPSTQLDVTGSGAFSGNVAITKHLAVGTNGVIDTATLIDMDETFTQQTGAAYGQVIDVNLAPAGALSGTTYLYGQKVQALWDSTVDGETTDARVYAIDGTARSLSSATTGNINIISGVSGQALHYGTGTVATLVGVHGIVSNLDTYTEEGNITNAYSFLAASTTNKTTGTITARYGLRVNDASGAGNITNQYGVYIDDIDAASTKNYALYSAGGDNYFGGDVGIGTTAPTAQLHTTGTALLAITAGRMGIGTTVPAMKLHIQESVNGATGMRIRNSDTTSGSSSQTVNVGFNFDRTGGGVNLDAARLVAGKEQEWTGAAANQDGYFAIETALNEASTEKLRVTSAGLVGIGNTVPATGLHVGTAASTHSLTSANDVIITGKLEVDGETFLDGDINLGDIVTDTITINGTISASGTASFSDQLTVQGTALLATTAGRVGIGTTAPANRLHVPWLSGDATTTAYFGSNNASNDQIAVIGRSYSDYGVYGVSTSGYGVYGGSTSSIGVRGESTDSWGIYGSSTSGVGIWGKSTSDTGVYGSSTTGRTGYFTRNNTAGTATTAVFEIIQDSATSETNTVLRIQGDGTGDLVNIFDGATEVVTVLDGGNVGIGTTAPTSTLTVSGSGLIQSSTNITKALQVLSSQGTSVFQVDTTNGRVGIGTTTPGAALDIIDNDSANSIRTRHSNLSQGINIGYTYINKLASTASSNLVLNAKGAGYIILQDTTTGTGYVGIGTTTPEFTLDVVGSGIYVGQKTVDNTELLPVQVIRMGANTEAGADENPTGHPSYGIKFARYWTGTTESNLGGIYAYGALNWGGGMLFQTKPRDGASGGSPSTRMVIIPAGLIGIGTTAPTQMLHVAGSGEFDNNVIVTGQTTVGGGYGATGVTISSAGAIQANDALTVDGASTLTGTATLSKALYVTGYSVIGAWSTTHSLGSAGDLKVTGNLEVDGETFLDGDINLGDIVTDTITINGTISASGTASFSDQLTVQGTALLATTAGRVGIGTTAPGYRLEVPWLSGDAVTTAYFGSSNASNDQIAVYGRSYSSIGIEGVSTSNVGVYGISSSSYGVYGYSASGHGVLGLSVSGVGIWGISTSNIGAYATSTTNRAGYFYRNNTAGTATQAVLDIEQDSATSETNTVLRIQGDGTGDLVNIFDGASEVVTILDGGNVGIGTTAPAGQLHTIGTALFATTSGNVGIGTTVPEAKLVVSANDGAGYTSVQVRISEPTDGKHLYLGTVNGSYAIIQTVGTIPLSLNPVAGNVGIGTTVPATGLHIGTAASTHSLNTANDVIITGKLEVDGETFLDGDINLGDIVTDTITINGTISASGTASFSDQLTVQGTALLATTAGRVGIGTTAPGATLDIDLQSTDGTIMLLSAQSDVSNPWGKMFGLFRKTDDNYGGLGIWGRTAGNVVGLTLRGTIGLTDPTDTIQAVSFMGNKWNGATGTVALGATETVFGFNNHATRLVTILGNGNVGIATTTPSQMLHVAGSGEFDNNVIVSGEATVGGGYGSTGATISTAGVIQANGAITTDGALTSDSEAIGGGYGSTGVTISNAGVIQANGALTIDGASTLTGAATIGGSADGLSVTTDGALSDVDDALTIADEVSISATTTTPALLVTQSGTGDILNIKDGATSVFRIEDGGAVSFGAAGSLVLGSSGESTDLIFYEDSNISAMGTGTISIGQNGNTIYMASDGATYNFSTLETTAGTNLTLKPGGSNYTIVGDAGSTSHSLAANDDLYITGKLEVDGETFLDGDINLGDIVTDTITINGTISASGTASFSDQLTVQGTALLATTAGRVGIGTTVPTNRLHVPWLSGDAATTAYFGSSNASNDQITLEAVSYSSVGVWGKSTSNMGVRGSSSSNIGVYGTSTDSNGVRGLSTNSYGVYGLSTTNRAGYFYRNNTAGTATTAVFEIIQDSATSETNTVLRIQGDGTGDLVNIFDGATEVVTVLDGGNVGIGNTAPASGALLHVAGSGVFDSKVGIGTTAPGAGLDVRSNTLPVSWGSISASYGNLSWGTGLARVYATGNNALSLGADGGNNHLYIIKGGNIGIGTTAPAQKLQVAGSGKFDNNLVVSGYSVVGAWSTTHSLGSAGDLKVTGKLEVDGETFLDGDINLGNIVTDTITINGTISASGTASFSDQLTVQGTALLATTAGNVGIGTTAPVSLLNVDSTTGGVFTLSRNDAGVSEGNLIGEIDFYGNDDQLSNSNIAAYIKVVAASAWGSVNPDGVIHFGTANEASVATTKMVINRDGNVGIGTTAPLWDTHILGADGGSSTLAVGLEDVDGRVLLQWHDDENKAHINSYSDYDWRDIIMYVSTLDVRGGAIFNEPGTDKNFRIESDNNENMFFVDGGEDRVGISTTTPAQLLHVAGSATFDTNVAIGTTAPATTEAGTLHTIGTALFATTSGRVGIGTTAPNDKLDVVGSVRVTNGDMLFTNDRGLYWGGSGEAIYGNQGQNSLTFKTSATDRVKIDSTGNVGIGTTAPAAKLDVTANSTSSALTVTQSGTGDICQFKDGATEVLAISDGGAITTSGDISLKVGKKIILDSDDGSDTYIYFDTDNDMIRFYVDGSEVGRFKKQ